MKNYIYCDVSGETSFSDISGYKHFSICTLTVNESKQKKLVNTMCRKKAHLYDFGWPKDIEIKATTLHSLKYNRKIPDRLKRSINGNIYIENILISIIKTCKPRIDSITICKDGFKDNAFRNAPYGIVYNYFAGKIIVPLGVTLGDTILTVDQRNKELHKQKHFDGYIETKIREEAYDRNVRNISLKINHDLLIDNE